MNKEKKTKYPLCPNCNNAMVWTFAFPYKEYACLPCDESAPMFNGLTKGFRSEKSMNAKKEKWSEELSIIARRIGGAQCAVDGCVNGSCDLCKKSADKNYKFKYYKSNLPK